MYEYRNPYIIDFTEVNYFVQFHYAIMEGLDFPDYYGCNWDALWDCLTDMVGRKNIIEIYGFEVIRKKFPEAAETFLKILYEWRHYNNDRYMDMTHVSFVYGNTKTVLF